MLLSFMTPLFYPIEMIPDQFMILFKIASKHRTSMLSTVPKHEKVVMYLMEKIHILDKLHSGMSYGAVSSMLMN